MHLWLDFEYMKWHEWLVLSKTLSIHLERLCIQYQLDDSKGYVSSTSWLIQKGYVPSTSWLIQKVMYPVPVG